jgi:anthranilate/para-aminobenzoate synthase component I/anthranilate/para-aminobenzoate synthase component II
MIGPLTAVLEDKGQDWICFLQSEAAPLAHHPTACDASIVQTSMPLTRAKERPFPRIKCTFVANPRLVLRHSVPHQFFSMSDNQNLENSIFLIPYYSLTDASAPQAQDCLQWTFSDFLEIEGVQGDKEPCIRAGGTLFEDFRSWTFCTAKETSEATAAGREEAVESGWRASQSPESIRQMILHMQNSMRQGDFYVANATTRLVGPERKQQRISMAAFVNEWLRAPSRFGIYVDCGEDLPQICCFSPERFVARCGSKIQTEPIKGTVSYDSRLPLSGAHMLWNSEKEMSEQALVTDLLRNDLNKVCQAGSVCVSSPFEIRRAGDLLQMQSVISGELKDKDVSHASLLAQLLPAGSITGTPKWAVTHAIRDLEATQRGYYTGVFALSLNSIETPSVKKLESAILIRGFFAEETHWQAGLGAGITTLSDPSAEIAEFELKWRSIERRWARMTHSMKSAQLQDESDKCVEKMSGINSQERCKGSVSRAQRESAGHFQDMHVFCDQKRVQSELQKSILPQPRILFVDHLDSFSENLIAALRARGCRVDCLTSAPNSSAFSAWDDARLRDIIADSHALVLSPGPGLPSHYPFSMRLVSLWQSDRPILGVCLGLQILLTRDGHKMSLVADHPVHGRRESLSPAADSHWLKCAMPAGHAVFYNSWSVTRTQLENDCSYWRLNSCADNFVAAVEHKSFPWLGVQYHPESFATEQGGQLLDSFVALLRGRTLA